MLNNDCVNCKEIECLCWDCLNKDECGNICSACDRKQFPVTECEQHCFIRDELLTPENVK